MQRPRADRREVVGRKLHNERRRATGKELGLLEHKARSDDGKDTQEVEERADPRSSGGRVADDGTHEQGDDRELGSTGDERGGHDRHAAVLLVLDGLGGHDAGNAAARGHEHGDEGLTGQAKAAEHAVHDEGDAGHVTAVLQEGKHDEQQEHLRDEAHDGADAGHDAVADQRIDQATILGTACHESVMHRGGDARDIGAKLSRVDRIGVVARGLDSLIVGIAALTEHVPTIGAKELVVGEVGHRTAQGGNGDVVHAEHDDHKDRQAQDTVGDYAVDLLGGAHLGRSLGEALVNDVGDHAVALAGDDGLGIVVAILLALGDQLLNAIGLLLGEVDELAGVRIALKQLDGVVATLVGGNTRRQVVLDVVQNVLDRRIELVLRHLALGSSGLLDLLEQLVDTLVLKGRDHHDRAAELLGKLVRVDLVAVFLHEVGHVEGHDHGQAGLDDLKCQVQVALQVGGVDDLDDYIGLAAHEVVARALLLGAVGGKRVDAGEVRNRDVLVTQELGFLFLNRDAGPVANVAVGAGDQVEKRGLAAVGVTRQRDMDLRIRHSILLPCVPALLSPHGLDNVLQHCIIELEKPNFICRNMCRRPLLDLDDGSLLLTDGKLVAAHVDLDRISERCNLNDLERSALDEAQVHKVTAKRTLAVKLDDGRALAHLNVTQRLHILFPLSAFMKCCELTDGHDVHGDLGIDTKACAQHGDDDIGATRAHHVNLVALDKAEVLEVVLHVLIALYAGHVHGFARFYHRKRHSRHLRSARHE